MTKYFEVVRRDGPARMGKLLLEKSISTPGFITSEDYVTAGSVFGYASVDEAVSAQQGLLGQKKLAILPYVPAALHSEPTLELPPMEIGRPQRRAGTSVQRKKSLKMQTSMCWAMPGPSRIHETW